MKSFTFILSLLLVASCDWVTPTEPTSHRPSFRPLTDGTVIGSIVMTPEKVVLRPGERAVAKVTAPFEINMTFWAGDREVAEVNGGFPTSISKEYDVFIRAKQHGVSAVCYTRNNFARQGSSACFYNSILVAGEPVSEPSRRRAVSR